jgi:glycosyltransferase involved in cell wall biosynthesis
VVKFFTPEDVNDLSQSMISMINNKALRDQLRENALMFVEHYNWEKRKQEYFTLVDSLTKRT